MSHTHYIYGNQPFEINEVKNRIIRSIIPESEFENSLTCFSVKEFFQNDQGRSAELISDFKNRCEMVSFFSGRTVILLSDLQNIPQKKDPTEKIRAGLKEVELVQKTGSHDNRWFDAATLPRQIETHHHLTGVQLIQNLEFFGSNSFYLELLKEWQNRIIYLQKGKGEEAIEISEYLGGRLKGEILFKKPDDRESVQSTGSNIFLDLLKGFITNPPEDVYFVLTANIKKNSEINKDLFQIISEKAKVIKTTIAYDDFRPLDWIVKKSKEKGLTIDRTNADLLIEVAGTDFSILEMELTKLSIFLSKGGLITSEIILENVSHSKNFNIFRISGFLTERDLKNSLECLDKLLSQKLAEGIAIFGVISAQFRRILKIQYLLDEGQPDKMIIQKLKLNPWIGQQLIKSSRKFSIIEVENIIILLAKYDLRLKYHAAEAHIILENICYQICGNLMGEKLFLEKEWTL